MKELLKNAGLILILLGVIVLAVPQFMGITTNITLTIGLATIVVGVLAYIAINRVVD